ncbi:MAG: VWA domain-containing protein, partial [Polyangiaceae bacterium]
MPKNDVTHITVVLDRSGSMSSVAADAVGGFNTFLAQQQKLPGAATMTLVQFDHEYQVVHEALNLRDVVPLTKETFVPRGQTALYDAVGRAVA